MAYFAVSSHKTAVKVQKGSNAAGKHVTVPAVVVSRRGRFTVTERRVITNVASPIKEEWQVNLHGPTQEVMRGDLPGLVTVEEVRALEAELDSGAGVEALRRFNKALRAVPADKWEAVLRPVFNELCFNLESFNPAFAACLLQVQRTIGVSDYVRRDMALKNLIQPLAGEYGMHNNQPQLKTHRELFSDFFMSLFGYPLPQLLADSPAPAAAQLLYSQMMRDILGGGGHEDPLAQASYALGYNLAIEYLADYEKTWMLDSFRDLNSRVLKKDIDWIFLEVHAEGEAEHAAIGHNAVLNIVPTEHADILRAAMADHDRDFAVFYNRMAELMEGH
ncbi:hypothetical protein OEZ85_011525 [Tetradesmus obliquus]|uniref:Thiaminase-2/PQQC domain-containing protein n=1 Tax=Tetradesmus obliquus TaxID=3088 RepID=A0ABY8TSP8_TETOB|nr:hypothetical protein OEZ85_011525 [Tetradesmus obliquus]